MSSAPDSVSPSRIARLKLVLSHSRIARYAILLSVTQLVVQLFLELGVAISHINEYSHLNAIFASPQYQSIPAASRDTLESQHSLARAVSVYHAIYMLATVMHLYITADSILHQNSVELIALNVINAGLFGYSIVQLSQSYDIFSQINLTLQSLPPSLVSVAGLPQGQLQTSSVFQYPAIVVSLLFFIGTAAISVKLHQEYGWAIYKRIGADTGLRRQMMHYFFLMMLLKLDVFFYSTFSLQFLVVGISYLSSLEILVHLVVAATMIVGLIVICVKGIRTEAEKLMFLFMGGTVCCMGYLFWKLYQAFTEDRFRFVFKSITFSISTCLILAVFTLVNAFICYRNFGQGLKDHLGQAGSDRRRQERERSHQAELGAITDQSKRTIAQGSYEEKH